MDLRPEPGTRASPGLVLAVDVGGTETKGALLQRDGNVVALQRRPTGASDGPDAVLERTGLLLRDLLAQARALGHGAVLGAGVAVPGVVDESAGVARFGANITWNEASVSRRLGDALGFPVVLSHDVRAAGLAEARIGAARGVRDWLFVALGTGIAGAIFVASHPVVGAHGLAGELGHVSVEPDGWLCGCGSNGCLETVASAAAIARRYVRRCPEHRHATAKDVLERARNAEPDACAVRDEAVEALARVLVIYQCIVDPELIVIGGGLSLAGPLLFEPLDEVLRRHPAFAVTPRVKPAMFGSDAGCIGAGLAAWASIAGSVDRRSG